LRHSSAWQKDKKKWEDMINHSHHASDQVHIGGIDAISRDLFVIKRGYLNEDYYYLPIAKVEDWNGNVLWSNVTEEGVKKNYERKMVADPSRYYLTNYQTYSTQFPESRLIAPKYERPYRSATIIHPDDPKKYGPLSEKIFKTEHELSRHVASAH
jgi:hypothetical protein